MRRSDITMGDPAMPTRYARDEARFLGGREAIKNQEAGR